MSIMGIGRTEILAEFKTLQTPRSRDETTRWETEVATKPPEERQALKIIQLVSWTITFDKRNVVGGPVDAVELSPREGVRWIRRKANCPEN